MLFVFHTSTIFRMRAQCLLNTPHNITFEQKEGEMAALMDVEVQHCAVVIATAFLNPSKQNYVILELEFNLIGRL